MTKIKAIETRYKGYRFRSRLEARWAVFFDELGVEWEYEPEGYKLSDGTCYLPDFYIPMSETFIEIKPDIDGLHNDVEAERKCAMLSEVVTSRHGGACLIYGSPWDHFAKMFCSGKRAWTNRDGGEPEGGDPIWIFGPFHDYRISEDNIEMLPGFPITEARNKAKAIRFDRKGR
jgi:hypothetical protein